MAGRKATLGVVFFRLGNWFGGFAEHLVEYLGAFFRRLFDRLLQTS